MKATARLSTARWPGSELRWKVQGRPTSGDGESIFQIGVEPARVDILQAVPGIIFERAWENRVAGTADGALPIFSISRDDLIVNELESGRPQDLADVDHLRRAAGDSAFRLIRKPRLRPGSKLPWRCILAGYVRDSS